jgi:hypothetical protein
VNDALLMRALHDEASRGALGAEIVADTDTWPVDNGPPQRDVFLWSRDEAALRRAVAGRATDDAEIVLEPVEDERGPMWRTWLVHREVALGTADVAEAIVSYDPNTAKAIVLLDFRDDGARRFGALTSANVGRRIAIVLDGRVTPAPVVNGRSWAAARRSRWARVRPIRSRPRPTPWSPRSPPGSMSPTGSPAA